MKLKESYDVAKKITVKVIDEVRELNLDKVDYINLLTFMKQNIETEIVMVKDKLRD